MNCKLASPTETSYHFSPLTHTPTQFSRKPNPVSCGSISYKNPHFFVKTSSSVSCKKSRTRAAINNTYAPPQTTETFYELLGISESGTLSDIKKAYKQLARKYHPDVSPVERVEENTQKFILVQEAYETLSDPQTRALYDSDLSNGLHLAFSPRKKVDYHQGREDWKSRWESQLTELKRMSWKNDSRGSWGARMRRQRSDSNSFAL